MVPVLDSSWRFWCDVNTDHHPGRTRAGADFMYYDSFTRRKISMEVANSCLSSRRVVLEDIPD